MRFIRTLGIGFVLGATCAMTACSSDGDAKEDVAESEASAYSFAAHWQIVGSLSYGETSATIRYKNPARFRAVKFAGGEGDEIDVHVRSNTGDAVTWVLDDSMRVVGSNDDANGSLDSHVHMKLPKLPRSGSATHYVVFRDYDLVPGNFTVELQGKPAAPIWEACNTDKDCVAVPGVGCCQNGYNEAVNVSYTAEYQASFTCTSKVMCPLYLINDTRQAQCNTGTKKCEMVAIDKIACGGRTLNPHKCPAGYDCVGKQLMVDGPGSCVEHVCTVLAMCVATHHWDTASCSCVAN